MVPFDWTRLFVRPYKVYTNIVFWIVVFCLFILLKEYPQRLTGVALISLVLQETLELAIPAYTQNLLILPFFKKGKWLLGSILYLIQIILLIYLLPYLENAIGFLFIKLFHISDTPDWRNEHITFSVIAFTIFATVFKMAIDKLIRDKEQRENELRHLKGQLNPHFLFNTLNNLYGLSVAESKKLPDLMLKLSDLLRYSLYDTAQNYVPLQKELDYIVNYVELERLRCSDKTPINLDIKGETTDRYIAPLLLIIFIENCFKHFSAPRDKQGFVHISLVTHDHSLQMKVENSIDPSRTPAESKKGKGGLGLNNVKQRLNLIYPHNHILKINSTSDCFEVNLQIELN